MNPQFNFIHALGNMSYMIIVKVSYVRMDLLPAVDTCNIDWNDSVVDSQLYAYSNNLHGGRKPISEMHSYEGKKRFQKKCFPNKHLVEFLP